MSNNSRANCLECKHCKVGVLQEPCASCSLIDDNNDYGRVKPTFNFEWREAKDGSKPNIR